MIAMPDFQCVGLSADEMEAVRGLLWGMRMIQKEGTGHGAIHFTLGPGKVPEIRVEHYIRPAIAAPWEPKA